MNREQIAELEAALSGMDPDQPNMAAARTKIAEAKAALDEADTVALHAPPPPCTHCGAEAFTWHDADCPRAAKENPVAREAGGYQYVTAAMVVCMTTSVPMTDEEALEYFVIVDLGMAEGEHPRFIKRRGMWESEYHFMPWGYDHETEMVERLG